jgi:hypothetical protein
MVKGVAEATEIPSQSEKIETSSNRVLGKE